MSSQSQVAKPAKRKRVPDALRRRAAVSCDRCKLRRAKCIRTSPEEACSNCISSRTECQSTLPRKQRVYGSLESLSLRYRALDALVKGLLQEEDTHDIDTLYRVAAEKGISMPDIDDQTPTQEIFAHPESQRYSLPAHPARSESGASSVHSNHPLVLRSAQTQVEERLIPTPHGVSHYVGPASSFEFAATARKLVARCSACSNCRQPRKHQIAVRAEFIGLRNSKALEPRTDRETEGVDGTPTEQNGQHVARRPSIQPSPPGASQLGNERVADFLPPRSTADALVNAFFNYIHPNYPLFHRSVFQNRYEAEWERKSEVVRDLDPGWLSCLSMIFVFGAQALEQHDRQQAAFIQNRYITLVHQTLSRLVSTTSLLNVQALLLLQLYEHNAGERNASWMILGAASRMAIALGMHREGANSGFDPVERNIRRRVWWTMFTFERLLSTILGRPGNIDDREVSVGLPDDSLLDCDDMPSGYTSNLLSLIDLLERTRRKMYPLPSDTHAGLDNHLITSAKNLLEELDAWYANLPKHLLPVNLSPQAKHARAAILLHICYLYTRSLVTRPILVHRVTLELESLERKEPALAHMPQDILSLSRLCVQAAESSINYLKVLYEANLLDGVGWLDAYYIYHGVFVLCFDILVRPIEPVPSRHELQQKAVIKSAMEVARRTRLAPTFRILAQIAGQFAGIVGALDDPAGTKTPIEAPPDQQSQLPVSQMQMVAPVVQSDITEMQSMVPGNWFEANFTGLPWNAFDMDVYGNAGFGGVQQDLLEDTVVLGGPVAHSLGSGMLGPTPFQAETGGIASMRPVDDWAAARALREMGRGYN